MRGMKPMRVLLLAAFAGTIAFTPSQMRAADSGGAFDTAPAVAALRELAGGRIAAQVHFSALPKEGSGDSFRISGKRGAIDIAGTSDVALLTGFNWYLRHVAHGQISSNGLELPTASELPAPSTAIAIHSPYPVRYALNENTSGYTSPYWSLPRWKHEIDIMAANGINTILIERGAMMVYYLTFRDFGYSDQQIRDWITLPARMNWQLMGNMCCFGGPISLDLLKKRADSAKEILAYMRSLGISPVLPGYYGVVPTGFAQRYPKANVIAQGKWNSFPRPDWLDPRDPVYAKIAADFYQHQKKLFGDAPIYDMEVFQEGGTAGNVPVGAGSVAIQKALEDAHPGALWMMLAWQGNPKAELIDAVDRSKLIIMDEDLNKNMDHDPETQYKGASYLYNAIWDFGGRNTMGAHLQDFATRIPKFGLAPGSHMKGISFYNEALDTDPTPFAFFTEMAWHTKPVDVEKWFSGWALSRYGSYDPHAHRAWQILAQTAYHLPSTAEDAHESLFNLKPGLRSTTVWGRLKIDYDPGKFEQALPELLAVAPRLRSTDTYQYDLVNLTRQVVDNRAYALLPEIRAAYTAKNQKQFQELTGRWLHLMKMEDRLLGTNHWFMLSPWVSATTPWAESATTREKYAWDVRSLLTSWGGRAQSDDLRDYANKDWSGLVGDYYFERWKTYFDSLETAMKTNTAPKPIDWYAMADAWNHKATGLAAEPSGSSYAEASAIWKYLEGHTPDWSQVNYLH